MEFRTNILEHVCCTYDTPVSELKKRVSYVGGHCNFLLVLLLHSNFGYFSLGLAHKQVVIMTHNHCVFVLAYSGWVEIPNLFPLTKKWILSKPQLLVGLLHSVKLTTLSDISCPNIILVIKHNYVRATLTGTTRSRAGS